ncbi:uncharacterized protein LOC120084005 [Benincasa hispida]|uniref:uncharacterized protein LOC120084005 n=1 Tax=Benincasa hispida TaxID=102211 RepID=UPI001900D492|nr:uncharacterized protein LOC120084005 [Benincasa hispida]
MAYKTPIGITFYRLVYDKACHLLIEIEHKAYWDVKKCNMNLAQIDEQKLLELQGLKELRLEAYENSRIYKEKIKLFHDRMLIRKDFKVFQKVLLFNSHLQFMHGKLKSKWLGPFKITNIFPHGVVEIWSFDIEKVFKVNGHWLKVFNEWEVDSACSSLVLALPSYS